MHYRLSEDALSTFNKGQYYAFAGEVVKEVSWSGHVAIVEGKNGRFPVHMDKLEMNAHLKKFKQLFDRDKLKEYPNKIEYRVGDLQSSITDANAIIEQNKLNLVVFSSGHLATYKAFEVQVAPGKPQ